LFESGGSFRTLAKATYYLRGGDSLVRTLLGDIRGVYFDPNRAPAASAVPLRKGALGGVLALDMIATPATQ
jgi:hypothetical protein